MDGGREQGLEVQRAKMMEIEKKKREGGGEENTQAKGLIHTHSRELATTRRVSLLFSWLKKQSCAM